MAIVYEVEGMYSGEWKVLNCEESLSEPKDRVNEYRLLNEGGSYRIMKRSTNHPLYRSD